MKKEKKEYVFAVDYKTAGKKAGDKIKFANGIPLHLRKYITEPGQEHTLQQQEGNPDEFTEITPDETWTNLDIIDWLGTKGVEGAKGTKEELLKMVKKASKKK